MDENDLIHNKSVKLIKWGKTTVLCIEIFFCYAFYITLLEDYEIFVFAVLSGSMLLNYWHFKGNRECWVN